MKNFLLFTICSLPAAVATGQTIEIFTNVVRGLEKTFVLNGTFGQSTATRSLWLTNRTQQTLRVYARPHVDGDALYLINPQGTTSRDYSVTIAPGQSGTLHLFGFLDQGPARFCGGHLALAITPLQRDGTRGVTRTVKLPVTLNFKGEKPKTAAKPVPQMERKPNRPSRPSPVENTKPGKPERYEVVTYQGLPMRWHTRHLPIKVYSDHGHTGDTAAQYAAVVRRVVEVWNRVGRESGLNREFFKIVQQPGQADIRLDWTGKHVLRGSQGTAHPSDDVVGMVPLNRYFGIGRAGETLLHEICHMLGVAHSEIRGDIMYDSTRNYSPALSQLGVSARDKQMLIWLYSQQRYFPFRD